MIDSSEKCCHGRVDVERDGNWLHDFWKFLGGILGESLVQELVIAASASVEYGDAVFPSRKPRLSSR